MTKIPKYLQELKELEAKATPGKWRKEDYRDKGDWRSSGPIWAKKDEESWLPGQLVCRMNERDLTEENVQLFEADGDLICGMKNALPRILSDFAAMKEALEYYADHDHWEDQIHEYQRTGMNCTDFSMIRWAPGLVGQCAGKRAREVLEQLEREE